MNDHWSSEATVHRRSVIPVAILAAVVGFLLLQQSEPLTAAAEQAGAPVCFEAEEAARLQAPFRAVSKTLRDKVRRTSSGAGYIEIPDKANGDEHDERNLKGEAVYRVKVPNAGAYIVWLRVMWQDGCGNSCRVTVGEGAPYLVGEEANYMVWQWQTAKKPKSNTALRIPFQAGVNTLRVLNREDGVKIDQILITSDPNYVPVGAMPATRGVLMKE